VTGEPSFKIVVIVPVIGALGETLDLGVEHLFLLVVQDRAKPWEGLRYCALGFSPAKEK
jgi:hypothetical protein